MTSARNVCLYGLVWKARCVCDNDIALTASMRARMDSFPSLGSPPDAAANADPLRAAETS